MEMDRKPILFLLGKKQKLMIYGNGQKTNSNPAWQEIEVDDLMEMDEVEDSLI